MEDRVVKEALSYALGSDLHEAWRASRIKDDGTFEPRIKKSKDEAWNEAHGTDEVDIANCSFSELPSNWQYENLEAAKVAIDLVYDKGMNGEEITPEEILNGTNQTIVEYWNGVSDNLSQLFLLIGKEIRTDLQNIEDKESSQPTPHF